MYRTNAITLFHHIESLVDFTKSLPMRDKFIDFKCSRQIILNKGRQFRTSLDPTKSRSPPHTSRNQLKRSRLNLLSGSSNTNNNTLSPPLMTSFQRGSHDANVPCTIEGVITSSISNVDEMFLDGFLEFGGAVRDTALDYAETNTAGSKDSTGGAFFDFGGSGCGAETSGDTTTKET